MEKNLERLKREVKDIIPNNIYQEYEKRQENYKRKSNTVKKNNIKKFNNLIEKGKNKIKIKECWFKNLTNVDIPLDIKNFLALGPKFALTPPTNYINIIYNRSNYIKIRRRPKRYTKSSSY